MEHTSILPMPPTLPVSNTDTLPVSNTDTLSSHAIPTVSETELIRNKFRIEIETPMIIKRLLKNLIKN